MKSERRKLKQVTTRKEVLEKIECSLYIQNWSIKPTNLKQALQNKQIKI